MRLRWFDRLFVILAGLVMLGVAALLGVLALGYGRAELDQFLDIMLRWDVNRVLAGAAALVLLVVGLRLLILRAKRSDQPDSVFMRSTDAGTIRITVAALEAMVQRSARSISQVRDVKVRVLAGEQSLRIALDVMLSPDAVAKDVCEALQNAVKSQIEDNTGIPVPEVQVTVQASPAPNNQLARIE